MYQGISIESFNEHFSTEDDCRQYLYDMKWKNGYRCRRCKNTTMYTGRTRFHARCRACDYDESVTAHTIFQHIKLPLVKVFGMMFRFGPRLKGMSTMELAREFSINQKSSWLFKRKAQEAMQGSGNQLLKTNFRIDESLIIDTDKSKTAARLAESRRKKQREKKRAAKAIDHSKRSEPSTTDQVQQHRSGRNKRSSGLSHTIANLHAWVRGIHHHCSTKFHDGYVDEYYFRFHDRNAKKNILHKLIKRCMTHQPYPYRGKGAHVVNRGYANISTL